MAMGLQLVADEVGILEGFLRSSFGPLGADKMVLNEANSIMVTNAGEHLLAALHVEHPLTKMVVSSATDTSAQLGDGCKSVICMVAAGLRQACREAEAASASCTQPGLLSLAQALSQLLAPASDAAAEFFRSMCLNVPCGNLDLLEAAMHALLRTSFGNKVGAAAASHLAQLLTDFVTCQLPGFSQQSAMSAVSGGACASTNAAAGAGGQGSSLSGQRHDAALQQLRELLSAQRLSPSIILLPGAPVTRSRLLPGLLLSQGWASRFMPLSLSPAAFVVLCCPMDGVRIAAAPATLSLGSPADALRYQQQTESYLHQKLQALKARGVAAVVCTHRVPEPVAAACLQHGLNLVSAVEEHEARRLCSAAGILPVGAFALDELKRAGVGQAASCSEIALGPRRALMVVLDAPGGEAQAQAAGEGTREEQGRNSPSSSSGSSESGGGISCDSAARQARAKAVTLLLQGPSEGLGLEYRRRLTRGLALLNAAVAEAADSRGTEGGRPLGCSHGAGGGMSAGKAALLLVPGGGACEGRLAAALQQLMERVSTGGVDSSFTNQDGPLAAMRRALAALKPSASLPALRILHAMARAVPAALAGSAAGQQPDIVGGGGLDAASGSAGHETLRLLHQLTRWQQQEQQRAAGFVVTGSAAVPQGNSELTAFLNNHNEASGGSAGGAGRHPDEVSSGSGSSSYCCGDAAECQPWEMAVVADPAAYGVVEPLRVKEALWCQAVTLVVQMLRVDPEVGAVAGKLVVVQSKPAGSSGSTPLLRDVDTPEPQSIISSQPTRHSRRAAAAAALRSTAAQVMGTVRVPQSGRRRLRKGGGPSSVRHGGSGGGGQSPFQPAGSASSDSHGSNASNDDLDEDSDAA